MHSVKRYAYITLALAVVACSKNAHRNTTEDTADTGLASTWEWVRTDGGIANNIHETPLSTGKKMVLKITADSTYAVYTNSVLTAQGTYRLENRTCIHDHSKKLFLNFSANPDMMVELLDAQNLELSDERFDGVASLYKRTSPGNK